MSLALVHSRAYQLNCEVNIYHKKGSEEHLHQEIGKIEEKGIKLLSIRKSK